MQIIDQTVQYIIRPTRDRYHNHRLGPPQYITNNHLGEKIMYSRQDTQISFERMNKTHTLQVSFYHPQELHSNQQLRRAPQQRTCIIYLHANNGSRIEPLPYIYPISSNNYQKYHSICTFDSTGSGMSSDDTVTLGINQSDDLFEIVKFLKMKYNIRKILLWGRSMGASSALFFSHKYFHKISHEGVDLMGMILDSPFSDLKQLVRELAAQRTKMPEIIFGPFLYFIDRKLQQKIGHNFDEYKMQKYLDNSGYIPALFMVSKDDKLVRASHCEYLYDKYHCKKKQLYYIEDQHHENRSGKVIQKCLQFINRVFSSSKKVKHTLSQKDLLEKKNTYNQIVRVHDYEKEEKNNKKFSFQRQQTINKRPIKFENQNKFLNKQTKQKANLNDKHNQKPTVYSMNNYKESSNINSHKPNQHQYFRQGINYQQQKIYSQGILSQKNSKSHYNKIENNRNKLAQNHALNIQQNNRSNKSSLAHFGNQKTNNIHVNKQNYTHQPPLKYQPQIAPKTNSQNTNINNYQHVHKKNAISLRNKLSMTNLLHKNAVLSK